MTKLDRITFIAFNVLFMLYPWISCSEYTIPPLHFEALSPTGLRISLPVSSELNYFAFNGRINGKLLELEPGELSKEFRRNITSGDNKIWIYYNPDVKLQIGDYIGYWVLFQHNSYVYRNDNQTWNVNELQSINKEIVTAESPSNCHKSITTVNGNYVCCNTLVFQDDFNLNLLDAEKWISEQYIPINGPSYEFNYYSHNTISVKNSKLHIIPEPKSDIGEMRGTLDLTKNCTGIDDNECVFTYQGIQYLPPVKSGKIKSKFSFKYGRIEIVAKLPCGDWIYPEITLIPSRREESKIYVAYSRGNLILRARNGDDIGGKLLFSGYSARPVEPLRSRLLSSIRKNEPFCKNNHNYTLIWKPDELLAYVDGEHFGQTHHDSTTELIIALGVCIGGHTDFPDDYISDNYHIKPWHNWSVGQLKEFFRAKNTWLPTWSNSSELIVESVRVYSL